LCMTTRTSIFRMKASRKFGVCFWPWRRLNPKQAKIVAKINKKLTNQVRNQDMKRKKSQFSYQIRAKKLLSLLYGKLHTSYFVTLFKKANAHKGKTISNFFAALETRLDTTLYRVQFVPTLQAARQLISHEKVCVNNVVLTKPGYILQPGDVISVAPDAIQHVGQNIQKFLQAHNTQTALVGGRFRPKRRIKKRAAKKMHFRVPFFAKRILARKRMEQHTVNVKKNMRIQPTWQQAAVTKALQMKMKLKMRLYMMKTKRILRLKLRLKQNVHKNLLLKRPKTRFIRFQRTAKNMPVKTWMTQVFKKHKKKRKYAFRFPTKKVFYKPTHVEVNYHTLHIVFLFKPDQVYFPIKLDLQHVAGAFQR